MKRRTFIAAAAGSFATAHFLGSTRLLADDALQASVQATGNLLRLPATWDGTSDIDLYYGNAQIWPDKNTQAIFPGGYPGLTINKRTGDLLDVRFHDQLSESTAIHWHGLDVPSDMDGHPMDAFAPGTSRKYQFTVSNRAGMYFYHSHAHMQSGSQVYKGLYGLFRVTDSEEEALNLPSGEFEIPLVIQDVRVDAQSQLLYAPTMEDMHEGFLGNTILINGTPEAYTPVKRGTYRLRVVNASNARMYKLGFSDGRTFQIIGSDGGLLASPTSTTSVRLAPAERYDILVDFSQQTVGESVSLVSQSYSSPGGHMGGVPYPQGKAFELLRFDVVEGAADVYTTPAVLSTIDRYDDELAVQTRRFDLQTQITGDKHTINGLLFEMERIDLMVKRGDFEIWEFVNSDFGKAHPMHIHGGQFQMLTRNGSANIPAWEKGWKDTFIVGPGERVQVGVRFGTHLGMFLVHCHILEHEDEGMMLNYEVVSATDVAVTKPLSFTVWYNRSYNAAMISGSTLEASITCSIIDASGNLVASHRFAAQGMISAQIALRGLAQGTYTVCIGNERHRISVVR